MYPLPFVVLLMDCPASLDLAAYFNSAAGTLIGVNFPLGTPWALGKVDRAGKWRRFDPSTGNNRSGRKAEFSGLPRLSHLGLLAPMGENVTNPSRDYYVVTRSYGDPPIWMWEIQRRSRPLGVRIYGDGFGLEAVAKVLGEKALRQFSEGLAKEQ
jgi:hypothetical protein